MNDEQTPWRRNVLVFARIVFAVTILLGISGVVTQGYETVLQRLYETLIVVTGGLLALHAGIEKKAIRVRDGPQDEAAQAQLLDVILVATAISAFVTFAIIIASLVI